MTIISIRNQVLTILIKNGMFIMDSDVKAIKVPKQLIPIKPQLIEVAMDLLEKSLYVTKVVTTDNTYWVLQGDMASKEQSILLSPYTAEAIANIINQYREAMHIAGGECDKLNILEEDLQSLVIICGTLLNNVENKDKDSGEDDEDHDYGQESGS